MASATAHWFRGALVYIRELWSESQAEWYGLAFLRLHINTLYLFGVSVFVRVCAHMGVSMPSCTYEVKGHLAEVKFLSCVFWGQNSGCQVCWRVLLPAEPSLRHVHMHAHTHTHIHTQTRFWGASIVK